MISNNFNITYPSTMPLPGIEGLNSINQTLFTAANYKVHLFIPLRTQYRNGEGEKSNYTEYKKTSSESSIYNDLKWCIFLKITESAFFTDVISDCSFKINSRNICSIVDFFENIHQAWFNINMFNKPETERLFILNPDGSGRYIANCHTMEYNKTLSNSDNDSINVQPTIKDDDSQAFAITIQNGSDRESKTAILSYEQFASFCVLIVNSLKNINSLVNNVITQTIVNRGYCDPNEVAAYIDEIRNQFLRKENIILRSIQKSYNEMQNNIDSLTALVNKLQEDNKILQENINSIIAILKSHGLPIPVLINNTQNSKEKIPLYRLITSDESNKEVSKESKAPIPIPGLPDINNTQNSKEKIPLYRLITSDESNKEVSKESKSKTSTQPRKTKRLDKPVRGTLSKTSPLSITANAANAVDSQNNGSTTESPIKEKLRILAASMTEEERKFWDKVADDEIRALYGGRLTNKIDGITPKDPGDRDDLDENGYVKGLPTYENGFSWTKEELEEIRKSAIEANEEGRAERAKDIANGIVHKTYAQEKAEYEEYMRIQKERRENPPFLNACSLDNVPRDKVPYFEKPVSDPDFDDDDETVVLGWPSDYRGADGQIYEWSPYFVNDMWYSRPKQKGDGTGLFQPGSPVIFGTFNDDNNEQSDSNNGAPNAYRSRVNLYRYYPPKPRNQEEYELFNNFYAAGFPNIPFGDIAAKGKLNNYNQPVIISGEYNNTIDYLGDNVNNSNNYQSDQSSNISKGYTLGDGKFGNFIRDKFVK